MEKRNICARSILQWNEGSFNFLDKIQHFLLKVLRFTFYDYESSHTHTHSGYEGKKELFVGNENGGKDGNKKFISLSFLFILFLMMQSYGTIGGFLTPWGVCIDRHKTQRISLTNTHTQNWITESSSTPFCLCCVMKEGEPSFSFFTAQVINPEWIFHRHYIIHFPPSRTHVLDTLFFYNGTVENWKKFQHKNEMTLSPGNYDDDDDSCGASNFLWNNFTVVINVLLPSSFLRIKHFFL